MRFITALVAFILTSGVLPVTAPAAGAQTLTLYDDFSAERIGWSVSDYVTRRWRVSTLGDGWGQGAEDMALSDPAVSVVNEEVVAEIVSGRLRLALRTYGARETPGVAEGRGRLSAITGSAPLRRMRAEVTVVAADVEPCGEQPSRTRAQILAHFLSDGGEDDIFASLSLERHSALGDRIVAVVSRCRSVLCTIVDDLGWITFTRPWAPGAVHVLTIAHRADQHEFGFTVSGGGMPAETRAVTYPAPADPQAPWSAARELRVENSPGVCASDDGAVPRPAVRMDARFDDVAFEYALD